ncbi:MAG: hypothetical protein WD042_10300 [Phycisphaeraceae bacterium]
MTFTPRELARIGVAAAMMVFGGTVIIVLMTLLMGHYNSLAHSGPKAVLDGAVLALLLGRRGRWRCVALLGIVYGLVLLVQVGIVYLPLIFAIAGLLTMLTGAAVGMVHRPVAVLLAAAVFTWAASFGTPLKIYFGTGDANEPILWGMWVAEWPLRIVGAWIGVALAWRWVAARPPLPLGEGRGEGMHEEYAAPIASQRSDDDGISTSDPQHIPGVPSPQPSPLGRGGQARGIPNAALRLGVLLAAAIVPLMLQQWTALLAINGLVLIYAWLLGPRKSILHALLGVAWGYAVFALASYLWHRDLERSLDLFRTFALRFAPMAVASIALIRGVRAVDLVRLLHRIGTPSAVLLPLAAVLRQIPRARRDVRAGLAQLRHEGVWTGPFSLLRHPRAVLGVLLFRPLHRFAVELVE